MEYHTKEGQLWISFRFHGLHDEQILHLSSLSKHLYHSLKSGSDID